MKLKKKKKRFWETLKQNVAEDLSTCPLIVYEAFKCIHR